MSTLENQEGECEYNNIQVGNYNFALVTRCPSLNTASIFITREVSFRKCLDLQPKARKTFLD